MILVDGPGGVLNSKRLPIQILIAEDSVGDATLLTLALQPQSREITICVVPDGEVAMRRLLENHEFDLAILSQYLPKRDAIEIATHLGRQRSFLDYRLVVLTSHLSQRQRSALLEVGVEAVIQKPADWEGYVELARVLLDLLPGTRPSLEAHPG